MTQQAQLQLNHTSNPEHKLSSGNVQIYNQESHDSKVHSPKLAGKDGKTKFDKELEEKLAEHKTSTTTWVA